MNPANVSFQSYCARLIALQRKDVRKAVGEAIDLAGGNLSLSGTGLRNVVEWMEVHEHAEGLRVFFDAHLDDAVRLLETIDAHAEALEILIRADRGHSPAAVTVLRGLMEGTVMICYLFDANVPPAQTAARIAAHRIDAVQGNEKTLKEFGREASEEQHRNAREATDGMKEMFSKYGFELGNTRLPGRFTPWVSIDGERAEIKINMTEEVRKYLPDETFGWVVASGAVHSKAWFLPSLVDGIEEEALGHQDDAITAVVSSALNASEALTTTLGAHTGYDVREIQKTTFTRVKALIARLHGTPFSPLDMETYKARGKSNPERPPAGVVGPSFMRPGTTYGPLWERPNR